MTPITVTYSEHCLRTASINYWWYRFGSQYLFILIPVSSFLIYRISVGDTAWYLWAIGIAAVYYTFQAVVAFFLYLNSQLRWFRSLENPRAILEVTDEHLCIKSDVDVSKIEWGNIYDIRQYKVSWVFVLAPYMLDIAILPIDQLSQKTKSIIMSKVSSALFNTGQVWKIRARLACSYVALFFIVAPWAFQPELEQIAIHLYSIGLVFAIVAIIMSFTIRCPKCGSNWDSKFAKKSSNGRWPHWLFALQKCPFCGIAGNEIIERSIAES